MSSKTFRLCFLPTQTSSRFSNHGGSQWLPINGLTADHDGFRSTDSRRITMASDDDHHITTIYNQQDPDEEDDDESNEEEEQQDHTLHNQNNIEEDEDVDLIDDEEEDDEEIEEDDSTSSAAGEVTIAVAGVPNATTPVVVTPTTTTGSVIRSDSLVEVKRPLDDSRRLFQRLWTDEDEIEPEPYAGWSDLTHECLLNILTRLTLEDRWLGPMLVCKSWLQASKDPSLHAVFDLESSFKSRQSESSRWWTPDFERKIDNMLRSVVDWSDGAIVEVRVRHCSDRALSLIAERYIVNLVVFFVDHKLPELPDRSLGAVLLPVSKDGRMKEESAKLVNGNSGEPVDRRMRSQVNGKVNEDGDNVHIDVGDGS